MPTEKRAQQIRQSMRRRVARMGGYLACEAWGPKPADGRCEICKDVHPLRLDHDHKTGKFRGWLCGSCNAGLGMLGDTLSAIEKTRRYLKRKPNASWWRGGG